MVRPRRAADLGVLVEVLTEQQAFSRYPLRWPLPFPVEQFLVRTSEQAAWVCELDGALVGHVAVGSVPEGEFGQTFRRTTGCGDPAVVSVLFVASAARGLGVAGLLLDTVERWARERDRVPVLDVLPLHGDALSVYQHRGWVEIGRTRFDWLPRTAPDVRLMALPPFEPRS